MELRCEWSLRHFKLNYRVRNWRPFGKQSISYFICVRDVLRLSLLILGVSWSTQYVTLNLSPASSSQFTSLSPLSPLPAGWLTGCHCSPPSSCISSNRQTMWWLTVMSLVPSTTSTSMSPQHRQRGEHRAPLHQTIGQLLKVTKCWESFLLSSKKNISYDNGLILEAG